MSTTDTPVSTLPVLARKIIAAKPVAIVLRGECWLAFPRSRNQRLYARYIGTLGAHPYERYWARELARDIDLTAKDAWRYMPADVKHLFFGCPPTAERDMRDALIAAMDDDDNRREMEDKWDDLISHVECWPRLARAAEKGDDDDLNRELAEADEPTIAALTEATEGRCK